MTETPALRGFRLIMIFAPLIALALGSLWLYEVMRRGSDSETQRPQRVEPDFYVEKFSYVKMAKTGKAQYHLSGARLTHNPKDDSYDVELPVVNNLGDAQGPTTMRAERANINSDYSQVQLYDQVELDRAASATSQAMHARSDYLLVLPDDDVMRTPQPVEITLGDSRLTGTGMYLNNATREFSLAGDVHGTYQAPRR